MKISKNLILSFLFPAAMFLVMLAICAATPACHVNGNFIYLSGDMVRQVLLNACMMACAALAIWLQFKNGRFDFSGGATMILAAMVAGAVGESTNSPVLTLLVALGLCVVLSCVTALVYIVGRVPIIICTIGMTLLYESLTYLALNGNGIMTFYTKANLSVFGRLPLIFVPLAIAVAAYVIFDRMSAEGRKGKILAHNQGAGVNIGINEKKNVFVSYVFTGIILGMAATIYISQNSVSPQSGLATSGILFSYIVPVFMGMILGGETSDLAGIISVSVGMQFMSYGLNCMNLGAGGVQQLIYGLFVLGFYGLSGKMGDILAWIRKSSRRSLT